MTEPTSCCSALGGYCDRCDLLVGLDGLHVTAVDRDDDGALTVTVESEPAADGLPVVRGRRARARPGRGAAGRCAGGRAGR